MYSPCPIEPCFLLSSLRLVFHIGFFSIPYSLFTAIISISLSLHLVLLAPVNSCELHNYHLVLSFLFMYSSSGLSTDVFLPNKTNINTIVNGQFVIFRLTHRSSRPPGKTRWTTTSCSKLRQPHHVGAGRPSGHRMPRYHTASGPCYKDSASRHH